MKNKKSFIPKKKIFKVFVSKYAKRDPKDGVCCPNFHQMVSSETYYCFWRQRCRNKCRTIGRCENLWEQVVLFGGIIMGKYTQIKWLRPNYGQGGEITQPLFYFRFWRPWNHRRKLLKVSEFQNQVVLFSFEPKTEEKKFLISALMPFPCCHFYFDIKFGDRLYSKEKRRAWPVLFWI